MFLLPFASFFYSPYFGLPLGSASGPTAFQSSAIAIILLIALIVAAFKRKLEFSLQTLPYIALPLVLMASIDRKLEFSTNDALHCFSMLAASLLVFTQKETYNKWLSRSMVICGTLHLSLQLLGAAVNDMETAISSLFPMENEITFFYMLLIFCSVQVFLKDSPFWKKYSATIAVLAFASIMAGETIYTRKLEIGPKHALGIWLGLACGILFSAALYLWKKRGLPVKPGMSLAALVFLAWMLAPIITVKSGIFSDSTRSEAITRLDNWRAALNLVEEKPFGAGFGSYSAKIMQHWPTIEEANFQVNNDVFTAAHNQYLQILTETGWLGWLYYCALFAAPWLISIFRYLKTGEPRFLFIAFMLASMLSVMEVSEAVSMFAFTQIIHWLFLLYCVKALLPFRSNPRSFMVPNFARNLFFAILVPAICFLLYDRGRQLCSIHLTDPSNSKEFDMDYMSEALEIHPKNSVALWYVWQFQVRQLKLKDALRTLDRIEELSGHRLRVNNARAEIYFNMGNMKKACDAARLYVVRFNDNWTLNMKKVLRCADFTTPLSPSPKGR